jgi:hypothetical protein
MSMSKEHHAPLSPGKVVCLIPQAGNDRDRQPGRGACLSPITRLLSGCVRAEGSTTESIVK